MKNFLGENIGYVIWADDKILDEEWAAAKLVYEKYNLNWDEGKVIIQEKINELIECVENSDDEDEDLEEKFDEDFEIQPMNIPEGIDEFEVLKDLSTIAFADGELSFNELDIIHRLGKAFGCSEVLITGAIVNIAVNSKTKLKTNFNSN
jgi:uncharacterized tellurite resistance protein B-like protein